MVSGNHHSLRAFPVAMSIRYQKPHLLRILPFTERKQLHDQEDIENAFFDYTIYPAALFRKDATIMAARARDLILIKEKDQGDGKIGQEWPGQSSGQEFLSSRSDCRCQFTQKHCCVVVVPGKV
jgi:hypothetical protein